MPDETIGDPESLQVILSIKNPLLRDVGAAALSSSVDFAISETISDDF